MIVSSVSTSVAKPSDLGFKGIYKVNFDYTEKQQKTIDNVVSKLQKKDLDDSKNRTYEKVLKDGGFDVFISKSNQKNDAVDVMLMHKYIEISKVETICMKIF